MGSRGGVEGTGSYQGVNRSHLLWVAGELSKADIAREVGYLRSTVGTWVRENLEGEGEAGGGRG